jgi:hypothetical protein
MCDVSTGSRIYCSYSIIETAAIKHELPQLGSEDALIVSEIFEQKASVRAASNLWQQWQKTE